MKSLLTDKRYRYLSLIREISLTNFKLKYQGSVLGYFWSLAKPLAEFLVLYIIFTQVFKVGDAIPHYPIYLLLGVLVFGFWSDSTSMAMQSIVASGELIRKIYFPRIVLVLASTATAFITFMLNTLVILIFAFFNRLPLQISMLWSLLYFLELYLFILGVSFYLSAFYVKFRDISYIWEVVNRILFYTTPILYSITLVPEKFARFMILSPLAQIIMNIRKSFLGDTILTPKDYWQFQYIPHILVIFILISGYFIFNKMAAKFAEEV